MFDNLAQIAWGVVIFAVALVIGSVVLVKMGDAVGGTANTTATYLVGQLGSTGGGLASYTPLIIVALIGFAILGLFFSKKKGY